MKKLRNILVLYLIFLFCISCDNNTTKSETIKDEVPDNEVTEVVSIPIVPIVPQIITVDRDIISDTTWSGNDIYLITEDINISAILTIQSGAIIKIGKDVQILIPKGSQGKIIALGTGDKKVLFTSEFDDVGGDTSNSTQLPEKMDWKGIFIESSGSIFRNCQFDYAYRTIIVNENNIEFEISDCTFILNHTPITARFQPSDTSIIDNNSFWSNVFIMYIHPEFSLGINNKFSNLEGDIINQIQIIKLTYGIDKIQSKSITLKNIGIDYSSGELILGDGINLTLETGVVLKMNQDRKISLSPTSTIYMLGTSSYITSYIDGFTGTPMQDFYKDFVPEPQHYWLGIEQAPLGSNIWEEMDRVLYSVNSTK